jgi:tetratricopeptide (TPR) repeat protein
VIPLPQVAGLLREGESLLEKADPARARVAFDLAWRTLRDSPNEELRQTYALLRRGTANLALRQLAAGRRDLEQALGQLEALRPRGEVPVAAAPELTWLHTDELSQERVGPLRWLLLGLAKGDLGLLESIAKTQRGRALRLLEEGASLLEELGAHLRAGHVRRWLAMARTYAKALALADLETARAVGHYRRLGSAGDFWVAISNSQSAKRQSDQGRFEQAIALLDGGLEVLGQEIPSHFLLWAKAICLSRLKRRDESLEVLTAAYHEVERAAHRADTAAVARARFLAHPGRIADHLASELLKRDRESEAIALYTRVQSWAKPSSATAHHEPRPSLQRAYEDVRGRLDALEREVPLGRRDDGSFRHSRRSLLGELEQLEISLATRAEAGDPWRLEDLVTHFGPQALARGLGPNAALLSYYQPSKGPLRCCALRTDAQGELASQAVLSLDPGASPSQALDELNDLLTRGRLALSTGRPDAARALFEEGAGGSALELLHSDYLSPAEDFICGAEQLVISAQGPLAALPLHLARSEGAFLQDRTCVSYLPGPGLLAERGAARPGPGVTRDTPALFLVLDEEAGEAALAEALDGLSRFRSAVLLQGPRFATRERLLQDLEHVQLLYLGGHAAPEPEFPSLSYMELSDGAGAPARLTASDLARLRLNPECVCVLSGCSTAWTAPSADTSGLAAACLSAGASACVGSLWPIAATFARALMPRYYEALANEPAHLALRTATRRLRDEEPASASVVAWGGWVSSFPLGQPLA